MHLSPISLYFHIPFCTKKCPYCHFFVVLNKPESQDSYMRALFLEWQRVQGYLSDKKIVSIYFGGGTPSLLGASKIGKILSWIQKDCPYIDPHCEVTLEANPEQITKELMQEFAQVGINRVSIGVQSFSDPLLYRLGRTHSSSKSSSAIFDTCNAGITNISIDLMFELPTQTLHDWIKTLEHIETLPISHISLYNLVIEPNTAFARKKKEITPQLPSAEDALIMLESAASILERFDLMRYEISAFAKKGRQSKHNVGYWTGRPFLGLGPSAFSYIDYERFQNVANLTQYCQKLSQGGCAIDFREKLPYPEYIHELLAVALRLTEGVDIVSFEKMHAPLPQQTLTCLKRLEVEGYVHIKEKRVYLSQKGMLFYDSVASEII